MENKLVRVGITQGDACGVGYEIILKAFEDGTLSDMCVPIVYGSPKVATWHRKVMDLTTNFSLVDDADQAQTGRLNMISCYDEEVKVDFGQISAESGQSAFVCLKKAVEDWRAGKIDVLLTAPISKESIQSEDFKFVGHTEYLEQETGGGASALMILMSPVMKVALVTTHLPIKDIAAAITKEKIVSKGEIFNRSLKKDFCISIPRIAVLSLNPHAGDGGLLGTEEQEVILPAIQELRDKNIQCFGPYAADGFFGRGLYRHFDGVLAMYHDQGLAAFKALSDNDGVNYTAGLPLVRTSPDHGTAFDIAGKGEANENSFRQALYTAIDVWRNRQIDAEIYANPMRIVSLEREGRERREDRDIIM